MLDKETLYARWLTGEISPEEERALRSSGEWKELQAIIDGTQNLDLPVYDKVNAYQNLSQAKSIKKNKTLSFAEYKWASVAASLLIAVGIFWWLQSDQNIIYTNQAEHKEFTFFDGSNVKLNADTKLSYDISEWIKERVVELQGEAIFQVNKGNPFIVKTNYGSVEVLGTSFNVRTHDNKLVVTCYTGKVRVRSSTNEAILTKSQSVEITNDLLSEVFTVTRAMPSWTIGESRFKNESIRNVLDELERQYNVDIDSKDIVKSFTGSFTHTELLTALDQVCKPLGIEYTVKNDSKTILLTD